MQCGTLIHLDLYDLRYTSNMQRWNESRDQFGSHLDFANAVLLQGFRKSALGLQAHGFLKLSESTSKDLCINCEIRTDMHKNDHQHMCTGRERIFEAVQVLGYTQSHQWTDPRRKDLRSPVAKWQSKGSKLFELQFVWHKKQWHLDYFMRLLDTVYYLAYVIGF